MRALTLVFGDGPLPLETAASDRGMEFNCHNEFEAAFGKPFYYGSRKTLAETDSREYERTASPIHAKRNED
jgi:IS30 family transposase